MNAEARLAQQLDYLDGWPEAQRAAREAFDTRRRRVTIWQATRRRPVTLAQYAQQLTTLPASDLPIIGQLLAAMLDHALVAHDALAVLAQWADEFALLTAGLPPIEDFDGGPKLVKAVGEFADQLAALTDFFGHEMVRLRGSTS